MTSPYIAQHGGYLDRQTASSPGPVSVAHDQSPEVGQRPMRLKVLYTFDDQNKTNCLARWPHVLNIRTANLDEMTQIGVIELKTCLQAIVAASPELVAKLGQDYTVYAYDYSEYETPLVGQGLLSWVLASASSTPSAPAMQSMTVVTGRVCKNILGLFSNGAQETLEVKLRLVPVPTCLQSEYIESMRKYRDISMIMPEGFDAQAWTDFLKTNPNILSAVQSRCPSPVVGGNQSHIGMEQVQRLINEGYTLQHPSRPSSHHRQNSYANSIDGDMTRIGSPTPSMQSLTTQQVPLPLSRSASSLSIARSHEQGRLQQANITRDMNDVNNDDRFEEPAKKRAKIMKADYPGKSGFGKKVDSLRVAASTAASVRVFQPVAVRPPGYSADNLEEQPRAPTPIPQITHNSKRPLLPTSKSNLGLESFINSDVEYRSPYAPSEDSQTVPHSAMTSPEAYRGTSAAGSPNELTSSPPVIRTMSTVPSSPVLPALPLHQDSGFMSGTIEDFFADCNKVDDSSPETFEIDPVMQYTNQPQLQICEVQMKVPPPPPQPIVTPAQQAMEDKARKLSMLNARRAVGLKRSQTWAGDQPSSDPVIAPKPAATRPKAPRRGSETTKTAAKLNSDPSNSAEESQPKSRQGWNKTKRKAAIQSKLAQSVAAGEMPPFCENCGAIETPTWRKAYTKVHSGSADQVVISDEEGGIIAVQVLETNEDGSSKLFKIFKKTQSKNDEGFSDYLLCNPCGLWLANHKKMRPEDRWASNQKPKEAKLRPKRASRAKKQKPGAANEPTDMSHVQSGDGVLQSSEAFYMPERDSPLDEQSDDRNYEPELPRLNKASSCLQEDSSGQTKDHGSLDPSALAALQHAIQSSPSHFLGSKSSPIELDSASPDPARRTLFPSPKTRGPLGINPNERGELAQKLPKTPNELIDAATPEDPEQADKENRPPRPTTPDHFDDLFDDLPPATPSRTIVDPALLKSPFNPKSPSNLFKTPTRVTPEKRPLVTSDFFSSAAKAFLHPATARTPTRSPSQQNAQDVNGMTPFTRHLNEMFSDANTNDSPGRFLSEIGTLPPLHGHSPTAGDAARSSPSRVFQNTDFDFSQFNSSDGPMPSSPPAWFGVYEDPVDERWEELGLGSSPLKAGQEGLVAENEVGMDQVEEQVLA